MVWRGAHTLRTAYFIRGSLTSFPENFRFMTYLPKLFITAVLAWISFAGSFTSQGVDFLQRASAAALGGSLATVNGQAITQAMYDEYAHERRVARKQKEAVPGEEPVILAELISMELMVQEAKKKVWTTSRN